MEYASIILEMLERIKKLEEEVDRLKRAERVCADRGEVENSFSMSLASAQSAAPVAKRDTTRYMFEGNVYLKNRLVLAVVQKYVKDNPSITSAELKCVFSKSLQGSIGVVEKVLVAAERKDYEMRFFTKPNEVIHLSDAQMFVCNQWGVLNIPNFLKAAEQLGYTIETI